MVHTPVIPTCRRLKQEGGNFEDSLRETLLEKEQNKNNNNKSSPRMKAVVKELGGVVV